MSGLPYDVGQPFSLAWRHMDVTLHVMNVAGSMVKDIGAVSLAEFHFRSSRCEVYF